MDSEKNILPDNIDELKAIITALKTKHETEINTLEKYKNNYNSLLRNYTELNSKYKSAIGRFFSPAKERISSETEGQLGLFNEAEMFCDDAEIEILSIEKNDNITIKEYTRKKGGKRKLPDSLPVDEIVYELDENEKACKCCGKPRPITGEDRSEELSIIPMQVKKIVHVAKKYGPCTCDDFLNSGEKEIITAPKPKRIIPYSQVSPELLAYVIYMKYEMALPFFRLSKKFEALDIDISRATLCNWSMLASEKCELLYGAMISHIKECNVIQMDETHVQVLKEDERPAETKSYMWVMKAGKSADKKLTAFHYSPTRNADVPVDLLNGFNGFLQTDGYQGYAKSVKEYGLIHSSCLAHIRRKFFEAHKANSKSKTANTGLQYISKIYEIERKLRNKKYPPDKFMEERKKIMQPLFNEFKKWLDEIHEKILPGSDPGKAVNYALGQWNRFINFLESADLTPDNNAVENAIRPFVIGRKNWMFSNTPRGAKSSAVLYSLVESAKNNKLNVYNYLRFIFTKLPYAETPEDIQNLLPCNLTSEDIKI
jgi:transposase